MTNTEIVKKLIGSIQPSGKSELDKERLQNLIEMCVLIDNLIEEIDNIYFNNGHSQEHSVKEISKYAKNFISNIKS